MATSEALGMEGVEVFVSIGGGMLSGLLCASLLTSVNIALISAANRRRAFNRWGVCAAMVAVCALLHFSPFVASFYCIGSQKVVTALSLTALWLGGIVPYSMRNLKNSGVRG